MTFVFCENEKFAVRWRRVLKSIISWLILSMAIPLLIEYQWFSGFFISPVKEVHQTQENQELRLASLFEIHFDRAKTGLEKVRQSSSDTAQTNEKKDGLERSNADTVQAENNEELLKEFRKAFEKMVESKEDSINEKKQQQAEKELMLELDGMVVDETRSRIGRDFYDLFYQNWQAPEEASNFTIRISEQPTPTLGSIVSVKVNDEMTFRYRLQPRFSLIERAAKFAAAKTRHHLETTQQEYKIY